jgi:hypothetical protein
VPMKRMLPIVAGFAFVATSALAQDITFTQTDRVVPYPAHSFIQGDINHDGIPDFLGVSPALDVYAFKSDGIGNYVEWTIPTAYCPTNPLAFGDFKHNGKNDLLVSTSADASCSGASGGSFATYLGDGHSGNFHLYKQFPISSNAALAAVTADFTGDKNLDTVILDGNTLELYTGDGHGGFTGPVTIATLVGSAASQTGSFYNLIAGDYDGNGCPDLAWVESIPGNLTQVKVAYGDCHGNFAVTTPILNAAGQIDNIQTTDLDRDGVSDIVATVDAFGGGANGPTVGIGYGQKDRTFNIKLIGDPSLSGPIAVADMNGDGFPDIAYISSSSSGAEIKILEGDPTQSFAAISTQPLPEANGVPVQMAFGDYNRDGKSDLALLSTGSGNGPIFSIFTNTSAYPDGACVAPINAGIHVCSPGLISGPAVHVLAAGTSDNPAVFMELWVDGIKRVGYGSTNQLRATLTLNPGWHRFGYYAIDAAAIKAHFVTYVFVK